MAGTVDRWDDFEATGVASPGAGNEGFCCEDGVVGFVDSSSSDAAWFVEGVSGRGACVSDGTESTASVLVAWIIGSSTGPAERCVCCFLLRRGFLEGQGRSGCDNHGSFYG